jgi:hypothetical protein
MNGIDPNNMKAILDHIKKYDTEYLFTLPVSVSFLCTIYILFKLL